MDAIYRLTMPNPFNFAVPEVVKQIMIPEGSFTPLNAQACLYKQSAFFMLLLPVTVQGRVSDIWRSYFGQRLLQDIGVRVLYGETLVDHFRNAHEYLGDLSAQAPLYAQSGELVKFLHEWHGASQTLPGRIQECSQP